MQNGSTYLSKAYKNSQGYISRMYINNPDHGTYTYHYTLDNLALMPIDEINLYVSQNTFYRPVRNKESLKRLNMLYVDLDCYKMGYSKDYVFNLLCDEYIGRKIPRPTYIVDSGRGLYLLWKIDEDKNAFPRWKKVQHYLHDTLKELGSDSSVTEDVARVLRMPGSINSKSESRVEVILEDYYTYSLYEIIKDYIPEQEYKKQEKSGLKKYGNLIKITSLETLHYARIKDIETLLTLRDKNGTLRLRENCLFIYRYCCCYYYNDTAVALQMTLDLYRRLSDQSEYSNKDIERLTKSGEFYYLKRNRKFSNNKLIDLLDISQEEQKELFTLISKDNSKERKSERNRKAYKARLKAIGKETKDEVVKIRREEIIRLLKENKSIQEICFELRISKATYYRYIETIKKEDGIVDVEKTLPANKSCSIKKALSGMVTTIKNLLSQKFSLCITEDVVLLPPRRKRIALLCRMWAFYHPGRGIPLP